MTNEYACRVVSNILKGPLIELAPRFAAYAKPGAKLGVSGILSSQATEVMAACVPWFEDLRVRQLGDWALVTGIRNGN
jgi:ribosomal protein L11 methyltransferase